MADCELHGPDEEIKVKGNFLTESFRFYTSPRSPILTANLSSLLQFQLDRPTSTELRGFMGCQGVADPNGCTEHMFILPNGKWGDQFP